MRAFLFLFCLTVNAAVPGDQQPLISKVAVAFAKGEGLELSSEEHRDILVQVREGIAKKVHVSLVDLGKEADKLSIDLIAKGLTPENALQFLVITRTYQANEQKFGFDPETPERKAAIAKIKSLAGKVAAL